MIYRTNAYQEESVNLDLWKDRALFTILGIGIGAGLMGLYILVFMH